MSWVAAAITASTVVGAYTGSRQASAARDAGDVQAQAAREGIEFQREALETTRADLQPFREAGEAQLSGLGKDVSNLSSLTNDPNRQKSFIENNPFFKLLADDAQSRLFANQAARGKVGSGETAKALQNSLMLLGQDLLNQDVQRKNIALNQRFNLTALGENAAARQGTATTNAANSISELTAQGANATAAGIVGAANAKTAGINSGLNNALGIASLGVQSGIINI